MNRHSSLREMGTHFEDHQTLHERIQALQSDNFALRDNLKGLRALTLDLKSEISHLKNLHRVPVYTDMEAMARKDVERRESVNRITYCEIINVHCSLVEDHNIPGCGSNNIEKFTLRQREAMCTAFEHNHQDHVQKRKHNLRRAQAKIKRVMDAQCDIDEFGW